MVPQSLSRSGSTHSTIQLPGSFLEERTDLSKAPKKYQGLKTMDLSGAYYASGRRLSGPTRGCIFPARQRSHMACGGVMSAELALYKVEWRELLQFLV
jgi:hypothetical protein